MITVCLTLLCIFLSFTHMVHTGDSKRFCTHYESYTSTNEHGKREESNICWFSAAYKNDSKITEINRPPREDWFSEDVLDAVDRAIFRDDIPYTYEMIMKNLDINVYVLNADYLSLRNYALESLKSITMKLDLEIKDKELLEKVLSRVAKYQNILKPLIKYDHPCVGSIVSQRAIMCALQWEHISVLR